jgi:signal transduction histidine kinase
MAGGSWSIINSMRSKLILRQPAGNLGLFLLAACFLLLKLASIYLAVREPYDGLDWSMSTGQINSVIAGSPADGLLRGGDRVLSIDDTHSVLAEGLAGKRVGDTLEMKVASPDGQVRAVILHLAAPSPVEIANRLTVSGIAFAFWLLGVFVLMMGYGAQGYGWFILFTLMLSGVLDTGLVSSYGPAWERLLFHLAEIWVCPLAILAHFNFPRPLERAERLKKLPYLLFAASGLVTLLGVGISLIQPDLLWPRQMIMLWLGLNGIAGIALVILQLQRARKAGEAARLTIVVAGIILGFAPLTFLTVLPQSLFGTTILPDNTALAFLILIPIGYGYAIFRQQLIRAERYVNYAVALFLTACLLGGVYGLGFLALHPLVPEKYHLAGELALFISLSLVTTPFFQYMLDKVRGALYGRWSDEPSALELVSQALAEPRGDLETILVDLAQALQQAMQIEFARLLLPGKVVLVEEGKPLETAALPALKALWGQPLEISAFQLRPMEELSRVLARCQIQAESIPSGGAQRWVCLRRQEQLLGLMILGKQRGGKEFGQRDIRLLDVLLRQAMVSIDNAALVDELELRTGVIRQLHQRLAATREEERKRLSHDLHDRIIQALVALNYHIHQTRRQGTVQEEHLVELQSELRQILADTRQICADLRPPVLDAVGVVQLIRARVFELREQSPYTLHFLVLGEESKTIPPGTAAILYSVFQEGMQNIRKHARPKGVGVSLDLRGEGVRLVLKDDGQGFHLPRRLEELTLTHHFGLAGMKERVEMAGGEIHIQSAPGQGCRLECSLPLEAETINEPRPSLLPGFQKEGEV